MQLQRTLMHFKSTLLQLMYVVRTRYNTHENMQQHVSSGSLRNFGNYKQIKFRFPNKGF